MRLGLLLLAAFCGLAARASAAPPLEAYGRQPAADHVALSPSGELIGLTLRDGDATTVQVIRPGGESIYSTRLSARKVRQVEWAGDDHLIVLVSETVSSPGLVRDAEMAGGYFVNVRTGKAGIIFGGSRRMLRAVLGYFGAASVGGRRFAYVGGIASDRIGAGANYPDLYRIDLESGQESLVTMSGSGSPRWVVNSEGGITVMSLYDATGQNLTVYSGLREQVLFRAATRGPRSSLLGSGRTPGSALVSVATDATVHITEFTPGGAPNGEVLISDETGASPLWHPESGLLIGFRTEGRPRYFASDRQQKTDAALKAFAGLRAELVSVNRTFDRMIVRTEGAKDSGTYWLVDLAKRSADPIAYVRPEIEPAEVAAVRAFAYRAGDGLALDGALTLPPGRPAKGLPLVVLPHDGPIASQDRLGFDWLAQAFASRGYAVLQPNYRGTLGYGEAFRRAADGEVGRKMQSDLSDGVLALAREGVVDPQRVCIVGIGYGGYAALAGVTLQQGQYRCAASVNGVSHYGKVLLRETTLRTDLRRADFLRLLLGVDKGQNPEQIAPQALAARADAPVLLIHGEDDTVVPIDQSRDMERALKRAGKPVELVTLAGEDHWLTGEATRQQMLAKTVAFVEKHNPPD